MENEEMDMQKLTFFTEGNTFTGSRTKDHARKTMLRYLAKPDEGNENLLVWCWTEDVCFEAAGEKQESSFPLTDEGIEEAKVWLYQRYLAV